MSSVGRRIAGLIDRRGRWELAGAFLASLVLFGVIGVSVVVKAEGEHTVGPGSAALGIGIGVLAALLVTGGTVWEWHRAGGRPAQRIGLRAWRSGRLPSGITERVVVLRDLERRRRQLERRPPQLLLTALWIGVAALNIVTDHSPVTVFIWLTICSGFLVAGIQDVRDRRRRPVLEALLGDASTGLIAPRIGV